MRELKQQVEELTTQVATLVQRTTPITPVQRQLTNLPRCFYCNKVAIGHFQRNCPRHRIDNRHCYLCSQLGHVEKNCWQGNYGGASQLSVGPSDHNVITVAAVRSSAATLTGELAGKPMEMMLDSGSAVSLVLKEEADKLQDKLTNITIPQVRLITASGEPLHIAGRVQASVRICQLNVIHQFLVVDKLVTPVILGLDFLQQHNLVLNFASRPVTINNCTQIVNQKLETIPQDLQPIMEAAQQIKSKICAIAAIQDPTNDLIDDCSILDFQNTDCEMPECAPGLKLIIEQYKHLKPGIKQKVHSIAFQHLAAL